MTGVRKAVWFSLIAVLAALNLWRWLPAWRASGGKPRVVSADGLDLRFPSGDDPEGRTVRRDLFAFGLSPGVHRAAKPRRVLPAPTPTEPYRLVATASEGGRFWALIGKGGALFRVEEGGLLEGTWRVHSLGAAGVELTDDKEGTRLNLRAAGDPSPEKTP